MHTIFLTSMLYSVDEVANTDVKILSLSRNPTNGVQQRLLVLVVTMVAMDKVMRLMAVGMHNLKILTCMVMVLMLVIPITNSNKLHSSHSNNR